MNVLLCSSRPAEMLIMSSEHGKMIADTMTSYSFLDDFLAP